MIAATALIPLIACVATLGVITHRIWRTSTVHLDAASSVCAALDEHPAWEPYQCECGEWVTRPEDERVIGYGLARERVCPGCYLDSDDYAGAEREIWDDIRLRNILMEVSNER